MAPVRGSAPRRAKTMHKQLHSPQPITHSTPQPAAQTPQANPRRLSRSPRRMSLSAAHTPSQPSHRAVAPKDPTNVTAAPRLFNFRQESVVGIKRIQQYLSHLPSFPWPFPPFSPLFLLDPFGGGRCRVGGRKVTRGPLPISADPTPDRPYWWLQTRFLYPYNDTIVSSVRTAARVGRTERQCTAAAQHRPHGSADPPPPAARARPRGTRHTARRAAARRWAVGWKILIYK